LIICNRNGSHLILYDSMPKGNVRSFGKSLAGFVLLLHGKMLKMLLYIV
jgi:hypothetical protein